MGADDETVRCSSRFWLAYLVGHTHFNKYQAKTVHKEIKCNTNKQQK